MGIDILHGRREQAAAPTPARAGDAADALADRFLRVRAASLQLTRSLSAEDQCVQSMPDASPTKWHLAHCTWFFETLVLRPHVPGYRPFDPQFTHLFNSYYESLGSRHARAQRGLLTRPSLNDVLQYRTHVDQAVMSCIGATMRHEPGGRAAWLVELGVQHEQQHQELMLTDIQHAFFMNPLRPAYRLAPARAAAQATPLCWHADDGGVRQVGHAGDRFAFDNETPRHTVLLQPFLLASRMVSNSEYLEFIQDGGYRRHDLWLSDGWALAQAQQWRAPLYWETEAPARDGVSDDHGGPRGAGGYRVFTLQGMQPLDPAQTVTHLSFYEASAYAAWAGARLPTEFEWEAAAAGWRGSEPICGAAWQWTRSSYDPYPGYQPWRGPAGEYNGKFMVGQQVLRGGSWATPPGHLRPTYRNFFPPGARWQFTGLRLARDA
jgi:ergothioneine biosynthesis protein EgtB